MQMARRAAAAATLAAAGHCTSRARCPSSACLGRRFGPGLFAAASRPFTRARHARLCEGRNLAIDSRWAEGDNDRLPALAADCRRNVAVLAAPGALQRRWPPSGNRNDSVVFETGADPVAPGRRQHAATRRQCHRRHLAQRRGRPKRLELLHELFLPHALCASSIPPTRRIQGDRRICRRRQRPGCRTACLNASMRERARKRFAALANCGRWPRHCQRTSLPIAASSWRRWRAATPFLPCTSGANSPCAGGLMVTAAASPIARTGRNLCRSHSQGRRARRLARRAGHQGRDGRQLKAAKALGLTVPLAMLAAPTR